MTGPPSMLLVVFFFVAATHVARGSDDFNDPDLCSPCIKFNDMVCHITGEETYNGCSCPICLTECSVGNNPCPKGTTCVMDQIECNFPPCESRSAKCVPFAGCKNPSCTKECKTGYQRDSNGCRTCSCKDPCQELNCEADQKCVGVTKGGQDPVYHCEDITPSECPPCQVFNDLTCHVKGMETRGDGCQCPICITLCPVENNPCPKSKVCVMSDLSCNYQEPCNIKSAKCIPFRGCKRMSCSNNCIYGYKKDHNDCPTCLCSNPCKELGCKSCKISMSPGKDNVYTCA